LAAAARERDLYLRRVVESEHAQRALIDQMAEGVITLDSNGRLDFASQRFCALCGKSQQQLLGQRLDEIFDDARCIRARVSAECHSLGARYRDRGFPGAAGGKGIAPW
jgi:PAS domain S-box-containing protein